MPYLLRGEILKETEKGLLIYFFNTSQDGSTFIKTKKAYFFPKKDVEIRSTLVVEYENKRITQIPLKLLEYIELPKKHILVHNFLIRSWVLRQKGLIR